MPSRSLFPPVLLEEARILADTIANSNAGQPMRRIDIFDVLDRSSESGPGRNLVTASSGFGLTAGGYQAETLSLADLGRRLSVQGDESALIDAVLEPDVFRRFFETYANAQVPSNVAARSFLANEGIPTDRTQACLDLILQNGRYAGVIAQRSGTDYVLSRQHAIEARSAQPTAVIEAAQTSVAIGQQATAAPAHPPAPLLPGLHINVEVHLPSDQTPEVYDAIFASMRKHLIDARSMAQSD